MENEVLTEEMKNKGINQDDKLEVKWGELNIDQNIQNLVLNQILNQNSNSIINCLIN